MVFQSRVQDSFAELHQRLEEVVQNNREHGIDASTVPFDPARLSRSEARKAALKQRAAEHKAAGEVVKEKNVKEQAKKPSEVPVAHAFGIYLYPGRVEKFRGADGGSRPLAGVSAQVVTAEELERRVTVTRLALTGVFAFGFKRRRRDFIPHHRRAGIRLGGGG